LDHAVLQRWFDDYFKVDAKLDEIVWASMFRFHSRLASKFRVGNAFLAGDAAHIHNPAGGQGLNLGVGDAVNLAWKLAQVVKGEAPEWLLDTYEEERRPIARTVLKRTDLGFKLETGNSAIAVWMRTHVATRLVGFVSRLAPVRRMFFHMFSQLWIGYRGSRAVGRAVGQLKAGVRAPYVPGLPDTPGYQVLLFSVPAVQFEGPVTSHVIPASDVAAYRAYQVDGPRLVLIRPDGHVAAVAETAAGIIEFLDTVLVRVQVRS
jgi:hypothetical protein